ncbi:uncharacterized protein LOC119068943 [Bradysia coprophila]|uniref:uncharacterized protein LOC119068943 n=1 Tax=Bradysia coprophila TaxID=38358 RepID=UPI00187DD570|nr:uncharacterized protein LOC119068943 [Bradysia coprophila]
MAMPVHTSSEHNKHPKSLGTLKLFLSNPCGFESQLSGSDPTNSRLQYALENIRDVKFYPGKIESSARTGLSDFKTGYLKNFLLTDFNIPHSMEDQIIVSHHEAWKHQSNPNLLPNGKHLDIEFLKDLSDDTKRLAEESARKFDIASDDDKQQLLTILEDCDERLQRLLVVFYQMHQNLDNFKINFRQDDFATENIRKVYAKAMDIIQNGLCDVRTAMHKLYQMSGMKNQPARIVDVEKILNNPFKTDSIGDWVNVRQLHDQLKYMTRFFGIWVNEIQETK